MARKPSALASLDIVGEGLAQQDGLAERLSRQRAARATAERPVDATIADLRLPATPATDGRAGKDHNAWRRGKALLQVAIADDVHLELSILAKRRRMTMSQLVKEALNQWLDGHGYALRVPD